LNPETIRLTNSVSNIIVCELESTITCADIGRPILLFFIFPPDLYYCGKRIWTRT